jgi:hypothetical protein
MATLSTQSFSSSLGDAQRRATLTGRPLSQREVGQYIDQNVSRQSQLGIYSTPQQQTEPVSFDFASYQRQYQDMIARQNEQMAAYQASMEATWADLLNSISQSGGYAPESPLNPATDGLTQYIPSTDPKAPIDPTTGQKLNTITSDAAYNRWYEPPPDPYANWSAG